LVNCLSCGEGALTRVYISKHQDQRVFLTGLGSRTSSMKGVIHSFSQRVLELCSHLEQKCKAGAHLLQCDANAFRHSNLLNCWIFFISTVETFFPLAHFNSCFLLEHGSFLPNQRPDEFPSAVNPTIDPRQTPDALSPTDGTEVSEFTSSERSSSFCFWVTHL